MRVAAHAILLADKAAADYLFIYALLGLFRRLTRIFRPRAMSHLTPDMAWLAMMRSRKRLRYCYTSYHYAIDIRKLVSSRAACHQFYLLPRR